MQVEAAELLASAQAILPPLSAGGTYHLNLGLTVSAWTNELHSLTITVDPGSQISETNESDNTRVLSYLLQNGSCP